MKISDIDKFNSLVRQRDALMGMQDQLAKLAWPVSQQAEITKKLSPGLKAALQTELDAIEKEIERM